MLTAQNGTTVQQQLVWILKEPQGPSLQRYELCVASDASDVPG